MPARDETVYVRHMLDAIDRIRHYLGGVDEERFFADSMLQDAVIRQLGVLGEAAGRISRETCQAAPGIPWAKVTGTRHRLIHDYFEVDSELLWTVVTRDLDPLEPQLETLLRRLREDT
jgi:uncharacterized protein with HEPN domain